MLVILTLSEAEGEESHISPLSLLLFSSTAPQTYTYPNQSKSQKHPPRVEH
jgi:hypothetical protein